jgi:hypothetical protein
MWQPRSGIPVLSDLGNRLAKSDHALIGINLALRTMTTSNNLSTKSNRRTP